MFRYESNASNVISAIEQKKRRATETIGLYVEGEAKLRCPVDTGNLRSSISHESDTEKATIGSNVEYAVWQEKGSSRTKAQPYLEPAATNNVNTIRRLVSEMMRL